jgi:hypothetical protein
VAAIKTGKRVAKNHKLRKMKMMKMILNGLTLIQRRTRLHSSEERFQEKHYFASSTKSKRRDMD